MLTFIKHFHFHLILHIKNTSLRLEFWNQYPQKSRVGNWMLFFRTHKNISIVIMTTGSLNKFLDSWLHVRFSTEICWKNIFFNTCLTDFLQKCSEQTLDPWELKVKTGLLQVTLGTNNLHMKMGKSTCCGQSEFYHSFHSNCVSVQIIEKGSMLMIIWHQPELSPCTIVCKVQ